MKRIGLFFGSFNPIHVGHLIIAEYMVEFTELDQVWFVVSPKNPLKEKESLLNEKHRIRMVRMAIEYDSRFKVSSVEFDMPRPSYTITTMEHLSGNFPQYEFSLIMGMDNLATLHKWKRHEELMKNYPIYVYPRVTPYSPHVVGGPPPLSSHPNVLITEAPIVEISSSFIRKAIAEGKNVSHMVTPAVGKYIKEMHFYKRGGK